MVASAASGRPPAPARPGGDDRGPALEQLELALSAVTRWLCGREMIGEVGRRARCELTPAALWLLEHLDRSGPLRVSDVAECLHVDRSTMTQRLHALDAGRLITRASDPADRRVSVITISPRGRRLLARVRAARLELLRDALPDSSPRQLRQTAELLERIRSASLG